jgi:hypothetical protein
MKTTLKVMLSAFEVDANGVFKVIYVNAIDEELINEAKGCLHSQSYCFNV